MNHKTTLHVCFAVLTSHFCGYGGRDAPKLTFKFTTIKVKGASNTRVFGVNNAGVMVGGLRGQQRQTAMDSC